MLSTICWTVESRFVRHALLRRRYSSTAKATKPSPTNSSHQYKLAFCRWHRLPIAPSITTPATSPLVKVSMPALSVSQDASIRDGALPVVVQETLNPVDMLMMEDEGLE